MPGLVRHLEDAGVIARGTGQKATPETVPGVAARIEGDFGGEILDDQRDALRREPGLSDRVAAMQAPKSRRTGPAARRVRPAKVRSKRR